ATSRLLLTVSTFTPRCNRSLPSMADFNLQKSFNIDNGELDGLSPQECFVLGYELAQIDSLTTYGAPFEKPVHAANKERIEKSLEGLPYELKYMSDDVSETWMLLTVW